MFLLLTRYHYWLDNIIVVVKSCVQIVSNCIKLESGKCIKGSLPQRQPERVPLRCHVVHQMETAKWHRLQGQSRVASVPQSPRTSPFQTHHLNGCCGFSTKGNAQISK